MLRFRRLRRTQTIRNLVRETTLCQDDLIQPYFVVEGRNKKEPIHSMPGIFRYSIDNLCKAVSEFHNNGGQALLLFGIPQTKDLTGKESYKQDNIIQKALKTIKKEFPDMVVATDVCLCAYMKHGHCGILKDKYVDNDETIKILGKMAVSHAEAGSDIIAPSDMMDFRIGRIRNDLDSKGFIHTLIMSYAVKYSSAFYGPFRDAAHSAPEFGDRKTYQMDAGNKKEAIKEALEDIAEGADMIMVKPALSYLDVIAEIKNKINNPVVAYSVSGEYSMIKAAAQKLWVDEKEIVKESLLSMKRAGADIIITYYAKDALKWMN